MSNGNIEKVGEGARAKGEGANPRRARRGFAAMTPEQQKEIASKGGKAAHARGTAHEFTTETARAAGRKGGQASQAKRTTAQRQEIARRAGKASATPRSKPIEEPACESAT